MAVNKIWKSKKRFRHGGLAQRGMLAETLEPRVLLAASPVISEFQAINTSTIQDEDGDFSDWVEIRNPNIEEVNLNGYYLTDDPNNLTKWSFPAVTVDAGGQLLVYASDKDRAVADSELHANFKLSGNGEYLALVEPNGTTIAYEYQPEYPEQFEDQSYGLAVGRDATLFLSGDVNGKILVPENGDLGLDWTQVGFNDANWNAGQEPLGFEQVSQPFELNSDFSSLDDWTVDIPEGGTSTVEIVNNNLVINAPARQSSEGERGLNALVTRPIPAEALSFDIVTHVSKNDDNGNPTIVIIDGNTGIPGLTFQYVSDSNFRFEDAEGDTVGSRKSSRNNTDFFMRVERDGIVGQWSGYFKLQEADDWMLVDTITDEALEATFEPTDFGVTAITVRNPVVATFHDFNVSVPEGTPVYGPLLKTDVEADLKGNNSSIYMRFPFNVEGDPSRFDEMNLTAQFDDGFLAYINGVEIAANNVPVEPAWNSSATGEFGAVRGNIPLLQFNVTSSLPALQSGENILAIQAMNVDASDRDFFFDLVDLNVNEITESTTQFFISPTPGKSNELPSAPIPKIVGEQGIFYGNHSVELMLTEELPSLQIRYTLDGSDPTENSTLYSGAINLTQSAMLQARTFDPSPNPAFTASNAVGGTFFAFDESLRDRDSDLPIIILDSLGQSLPGTGSTTLRPVNVMIIDQDRTTNRSSINEADIEYLGRGGVRDRGSSSGGLSKPNMAFELWGESGNDQDDDENHSILGLASDSDYVFYAGTTYDPTLIHNAYAFELSNQVDQWAPDYRMVEVFFNRRDGIVSGADYHGVYTIHEKVTVSNGRLDIARIDPSVTKTPEEALPGEPNISGGYIWKVDRGDPGETPFSGGGQSLNWVYPKSPSTRRARPDQKATGQQQDWVQDYLGEVTSKIRNTKFEDPDNYLDLIDLESFLEHHLLNVLTFNVDAFRLSGYIHKDRDKGVVYGPVWDFDRALNSTDGRDADPFVWRSRSGDQGTDFFNYGPWYGQLFDEPGFWQAYVDQWHFLRDREFSNENLDKIADDLAAQIRESVARENADCTVCRHIRERGGFDQEIEEMKSWLHDRAGFMHSNFAQPALIQIGEEILDRTLTGVNVAVGQEVSIVPTPVDVNNDTPFVSGENGVQDARFFVPTNDDLGDTWTEVGFDDAAWIEGKLGFGFGTSSGFEENYTTSFVPKELTDNDDVTNVFIRIPFNLDSVNDIDQLVLRMKYDDGFVAHLNGQKVREQNLRQPAAWDSRANSHRNSEAIVYEDFDLTSFKDALRVGENILAIRGINSSASSSDMLMVPELVKRVVTFEPSPTGQVFYTTDGTDPRGPDGNPSANAIELPRGQTVSFTENTQVIARNFDTSDRGSESQIVLTDWSGPTHINVVVNEPNLAITELNYNPYGPTDAELLVNPDLDADHFEFIEIKNLGLTTADLVGTTLADGVEFDFAKGNMTSLEPGGYTLIVSNLDAFQQRYGNDLPVAGEYTGNLNNNGEDVDLRNGTDDVIFSVRFGDNDPWPALADGPGATLELGDDNTAPALQSKYYSWNASQELGGTPGSDGAGHLGVVINEVLAHTDAPIQELDSIELFNTTDDTIDISGWYLSDSGNNLTKYKIPAGTLLASGSYVVFTERDFNQGENAFGLSGANGEDLYLVQGDGNGVSGFADEVHFNGTPNGESLGRLPNGEGRLAPLTSRSLGAENGDPRVGPVIISELNYNPPTPSSDALALYPNLGKSDLEFVEVHNSTAADINLTDWRLRGGIDYNFDDNTTLPANGSIVVLSFNPENPENAVRMQAFRTEFGINEDVVLVGGYGGQLSNADDEVRLFQPDVPDPVDGGISRFMADEVLYDDQAPWPSTADGNGNSIQRRGAGLLGNFGSSWYGGAPSPGIADFDGGGRGDFNQDGRVDVIDVDLLFVQARSQNPDLAFDLTADGAVDENDRTEMIKNVIGTHFGDSDLDGKFGSRDLVNVFIAGEYEDGIAGNSTWGTGDWDGDGDFTTGDLVLAFQDGGYDPLAATNGQADVAGAIASDPQFSGNLQVADDDFEVADRDVHQVDLDLVAQDKIFAAEDDAWKLDADEEWNELELDA